MPLGYVRGTGAPQDCVCFADWEIKDGAIMWLSSTTKNTFGHTSIPESATLETVGEFYQDADFHYLCFGQDFAIVSEKDNREELDRFEREIKQYIFKRDMNRLVLEREAIWTELKRVETEIGNLWSKLC